MRNWCGEPSGNAPKTADHPPVGVRAGLTLDKSDIHVSWTHKAQGIKVKKGLFPWILTNLMDE
jgi:hypothetical protein